MCGMHYQRHAKHGAFDLPVPVVSSRPGCSIKGCVRLARSGRSRTCEVHCYRYRRTGKFDDPVYGKWTLASHGYLVRMDPSHPIASVTGYLYQHRAVLYDHIGPGCHRCHWCDTEVEWMKRHDPRALNVDHVDADKLNNDLSNLVPSCRRCNSTRGLFISWVQKHRDDPFLADLFKVARSTTPSDS